MGEPLPQPVLFHYEESIYAHKILWYFALRGISYSECIVLNRLPRPTLAALGVNYRRIPVLALGRDVYVDTRLISRKLSALYPPSPAHPQLDPRDAHAAGLASIIGAWTNDGGVFWRAVSLLPAWRAPQMRDPQWLADRKEMTGLELSEELMAKGRAEGLAHVRIAFDVMESGVLADGREWVLGTEGPTSADVEAVYPFEWLVMEPLMEGALPTDGVVTRAAFPRTWAWVERFMERVEERQKRIEVTRLSDVETIRGVLEGALVKQDIRVDEQDPLKLKSGQQVKVFPSDNASYKQDFGKLIGLNKDEIVIENEKSVRVHFPRWNFRIEPI